MNEPLSNAEVTEALETCAKEPVHIPGRIQPFGALLAYDLASGEIRYASANADAFLGHSAEDLIGRSLRDTLDVELWHELQNAASIVSPARPRVRVGSFDFGKGLQDVHAFISGDHMVVEAEPASDDAASALAIMRDLGHLVEQVRGAENETRLFELTAQMMRTATGYDRVMIYRFDRDWNGEIIAEARKASVEPMLGLRFPHWDIPEQARAIMKVIDLRIIGDVDQVPVPLAPERPPLDITPAVLRGVSPVHMQYLRNMGSAGTMTLSIVVEGDLWGIISFHHRKPRVPTQHQRDLLTGFLPVFQMKLGLLREQSALQLAQRIDALQAGIEESLEDNGNFQQTFHEVAHLISGALAIDGLALIDGSASAQAGHVPGQALLDELLAAAQLAGEPMMIESFGEAFPGLETEFHDCAGALVVPFRGERALCAFRVEKASPINWAGNPEKTITRTDGQNRLEPRGSFSLYLQETAGSCIPWTDQDLHSLKRLWPLLNAAERRSFIAKMNRQQQLMIDELNHRVRNILALVKSVSRQARLRYSSLASYSRALEARIHALAAAHDIGAGSALEAISLRRIIELEAEPHTEPGSNRLVIDGPDRRIRADAGPIFALVIHELMTNAVKYGALSVEGGRIMVSLDHSADGAEVTWREEGGPVVEVPEVRGFGTMLVEQAVPYELGGTSKLIFDPEGVRAEIVLPPAILAAARTQDGEGDPTPLDVDPERELHLPAGALSGTVLVIEDNFLIGTEMADELTRLGATDVEVAANLADAWEFLETETPVFAVLDVNLGRGVTTEDVGCALHERGIPFVFVSGYGERAPLRHKLSAVPKLTKPIATRDLERAIVSLLVTGRS